MKFENTKGKGTILKAMIEKKILYLKEFQQTSYQNSKCQKNEVISSKVLRGMTVQALLLSMEGETKTLLGSIVLPRFHSGIQTQTVLAPPSRFLAMNLFCIYRNIGRIFLMKGTTSQTAARLNI